jgi:cell filamentation protein
MYGAGNDPYCYPGTTVLKNRLSLRSQAELDAFEAEITAERASQGLPRGRLSYRHYRAIHRHLFGDVYPWAGKIRTVRIAKNSNTFCHPEYIDREMRRLFQMLAKDGYFRRLDPRTFAEKAAHFLAELNAIHPFREGNGRAQISFLTLLAERAGHPLHFEYWNPKEMLVAAISSFGGDEKPLATVFGRLLR